MKLSCVLFGLVGIAGAGSAMAADTCASPTAISGPSGAIAGTTCGKVDQVNLFCGALTGDAPDTVYSFVAGAAPTATTISLTNSTPAWRPALYLLGPSPTADAAFCADGSTCAATKAATAAGANVALTVPALTQGQTYYLVVTAFSGAAASSCGDYSLAIDGTLPVQLQNFSVQ